MNIKHIAVTALAVLVTTAAMAEGRRNDVWAKFDDAGNHMSKPRSRAELLAEIEIWQRAGLAELDRREAPDTFSQQYLAAVARYNAMRASPEFSSRVAALARERGESETGSPGTQFAEQGCARNAGL